MIRYTEKQLKKDIKRYQKKMQKRGFPYSLEELALEYEKRKFWGFLTLMGIGFLMFCISFLIIMSVIVNSS